TLLRDTVRTMLQDHKVYITDWHNARDVALRHGAFSLDDYIGYLIRMEPGVQTPEQTLELKSGSCRDSGWLLVQLCRHLGLAARFVSGYLIQLTPDVKSIDGPSGAEKDFTDLHAWCEVFLPGAGWIGLDPTSGLLAGEGHIPLACTPQPSSAAPIEGGLDPCEVEFSHSMKVTRIYEAPRVTKPYSDEQWKNVLTLGDRVDVDLEKHDVRLTMGGEPTFVASTDRDAPEWNIAALGPTKREYGEAVLAQLFERYGRGGALHFGQGKWYPGEQLPRWALTLFWRDDGIAIWKDSTRFARGKAPTRYTVADAESFSRALCDALNIENETLVPGYEDTLHYLWRERKLPLNVNALDSRIDDEFERARLRNVFDTGLKAVVGYVLPLAVDEESIAKEDAERRKKKKIPPTIKSEWRTSAWHFRDDCMYLIPGDSPMGYRLPLESLPWVAKEDRDLQHERDPFDERDELGEVALSAGAVKQSLGLRKPKRFESAKYTVRTALCVQAREGRLYVFMPPASRIEDYLALVAAVERAAESLGLTVVIEGYPPPRDPRVKVLQVTPDPGVLEVNIQPVKTWRELVENTEFLYDTAFQLRMSAEKFALDGRHTGTGGGNHFVLGGASPADSPFLRKPELLASLIAYWHNHPSLSYLFSGLFIGPTSQAPRVDEARNDSLYELEIAFQEIAAQREKHKAAMPPWLVDRTLRNIL
ncbi:MAG: IMP dehydrogenase, partial [Burkholderiales bacterium]